MLTNSKTLPDILEIVSKNLHILQISPELCNVFVNKPTKIESKTNKNIQDLIEGLFIKDGKVGEKKLENRQGRSKACNITRSALCCMQEILILFKATKQKEISIYNIPLHSKANGLEIVKYKSCNLQYLGKLEASFNIRPDNHWKDVSNSKAISVCVHF